LRGRCGPLDAPRHGEIRQCCHACEGHFPRPFKASPARRGEPDLNIPAGVGYLKRQLDANGGDVRKGVTRYNGGGDPHYYEHVMAHYALYAPALSAEALSARYFPVGK